MNNSSNLTKDKIIASEEIAKFLLDEDESVFILNGAPGTGKTFLINHLIKNVIPQVNSTISILNQKPEYEVRLTATTNPAASALGTQAETIHKLLGIYIGANNTPKVSDYREDIENSIIIIDEYSMIDAFVGNRIVSELLEPKSNNKIILVGDPDQFLAIKSNRTIFSDSTSIPSFELTENSRTQDPDILESLRVLRDWVRNPNSTEIWDITDYSSSSVLWSHKTITEEYENLIKTEDPRSITMLTYKNQDSLEQNNFASQLLGNDYYSIGSTFVVNRHYSPSKRVYFAVDTKVILKQISSIQRTLTIRDVEVDVREVSISDGYKYHVATVIDKPWLYKTSLLEFIFKNHDVIDIRPLFSRTFHKAQGMSIDHVLLDLSSFPNNIPINTLYRALYVAVSRARKTVTMVGELNESIQNRM